MINVVYYKLMHSKKWLNVIQKTVKKKSKLS